jgi:hypothetical protein
MPWMLDSPKLGSGKRFASTEKRLAATPGVKKPRALAAWIGRKKYGNARFNKLAEGGRTRNEGNSGPKPQRPRVRL